MELLPNNRAKELTFEEIKMIPTVNIRFRYRINRFQGVLTLQGYKETRDFYFFPSEDDILRVFPTKSEMSLKENGEVSAKMPLRISFGRTDKSNDFGYYGRFELLILNENRNVIAGMLPADIRDFIIKHYKSMKDYIYFQGVTIDELKTALKERRGI